MPTLIVNTNVPQGRVENSDTLKALSSAVASSVGKPEQWVMISLNCGVPLMYGGSEEPAAFAELISIGSIGGEKNKAISAAISTVLTAKLGIPAARTYIRFTDSARSDFGWNGSTF